MNGAYGSMWPWPYGRSVIGVVMFSLIAGPQLQGPRSSLLFIGALSEWSSRCPHVHGIRSETFRPFSATSANDRPLSTAACRFEGRNEK